MNEYQILPVLILIPAIHFVALISPGPDFFLILRNSLVHSRLTGFYSAIGLGLGVLWHASFSLIGVHYLFKQFPMLMPIVSILSACYLCHLGFSGLSKSIFKKQSNSNINFSDSSESNSISKSKAIRTGFFTNILNPKVYAYFFSFFAVVLSHFEQSWVAVAASFEVVILTFSWFSLVAVLATTKSVQGVLQRHQLKIDVLACSMFILFGLSMLWYGLTQINL